MITGKGELKDLKTQYVGEFYKNKKHGKGILTDLVTKITYEGEFVNNEQTGKGIHIYPSGSIYLYINIKIILFF